jgi:hypothetical protein
MIPKKELNIVVSKNSAFFHTNPPRELLNLLRERFGLDFEEKVIFCG